MNYELVGRNHHGVQQSQLYLTEESVAEFLDRPHKRRLAYLAIDSERDYQDKVWGTQDESNPLTIGEFVLLLEDYVHEARVVWAGEPKPETQTLEFIRKVAGIAVNCMEQHGQPHRDGPPKVVNADMIVEDLAVQAESDRRFGQPHYGHDND
jgi:hypothetical protein